VLDQIVDKYPDHNIIMVGHSLGGGVAIRTTQLALEKAWRERIQGMVIIDVVEGTAL
jgi:protein phosphatase methylesterase 1